MAFKMTGSGALTGGATLGCDPEFFISRKGLKRRHIVGSERILGTAKPPSGALVVTDGIQVEIHPSASYCRQGHASSIVGAMQQLKATLATMEGKNGLKGLEVDFSQTIKVTQTELARLTEGSRILGCMPSENTYGHKKIEPDGKIVTTRSAGGHIHFGMKVSDPAGFARICDVMIGIPSVLIDRDKNAAKRRKMYGRAGEYRTPKHGFEYRTLSNFWMRDYVVYALVFGQATQAASIEHTALELGPSYKEPAYNRSLRKDILEQVDFDKVRKAINTNDFDLAYEIFNEVVRPIAQANGGNRGLTRQNIGLWDHFVAKGLDHWFPNDNAKILAGWTRGYGSGWESWADTVLRGSYEREKLAKGTRADVKVDPVTGKAI